MYLTKTKKKEEERRRKDETRKKTEKERNREPEGSGFEKIGVAISFFKYIFVYVLLFVIFLTTAKVNPTWRTFLAACESLQKANTMKFSGQIAEEAKYALLPSLPFPLLSLFVSLASFSLLLPSHSYVFQKNWNCLLVSGTSHQMLEGSACPKCMFALRPVCRVFVLRLVFSSSLRVPCVSLASPHAAHALRSVAMCVLRGTYLLADQRPLRTMEGSD